MGSNQHPIIIVQGAQYGSEAKGAVANFLCERKKVKWTVRTGSINAGHTAIYKGEKHVFQQIPTGAVIDDISVAIGPGAYVNPETFMKEVKEAGCRNRVYVDEMCGIHLDSFTDEAAAEKRNLRIGATGKGCAEAIIHKIKDRGVGKPLLLKDHWDWQKYGILCPCDTVSLLMNAYGRGDRILIEGTQGTLLDFHTGPYPFVTSRQTIASAWVAEAGLSPALDYEVVLVARTFPIRVAGNSGPMPLETSWPALARSINARLRDMGFDALVGESSLVAFEAERKAVLEAPEQRFTSESEARLLADTQALLSLSGEHRAELLKLFETTTVTKRLRRIAELDVDRLSLTVKKEHPAYMVLTFLNYVFPELVHERTLHDEAIAYVHNLQRRIDCWIRYVSIGPRFEDILEVGL